MKHKKPTKKIKSNSMWNKNGATERKTGYYDLNLCFAFPHLWFLLVFCLLKCSYWIPELISLDVSLAFAFSLVCKCTMHTNELTKQPKQFTNTLETICNNPHVLPLSSHLVDPKKTLLCFPTSTRFFSSRNNSCQVAILYIKSTDAITSWTIMNKCTQFPAQIKFSAY